jgi:hypothetical protein
MRRLAWVLVPLIVLAGCAPRPSMRQEYADGLRLYTGTVQVFTDRMRDGRIDLAEAERLMAVKRQAREHLAAMSAAEQTDDRVAFDAAYAQYATAMARLTAAVFVQFKKEGD